MASHPIYQIYSKLEDTELKIWRRFEVMDNITVARLGYILMTMYEMEASHLFSFEKVDQSGVASLSFRYELPSEESDDPNSIDATKAKVKSLFGKNDTVTFLYDFGDGWEISLVCEKIIYNSDIPGKMLPRVIEGEGYGIIEDCGGTGGLEEIALAYEAGEGEAYDHFVEWMGLKEFDIAFFEIDDINYRLQKAPRIYRDIYEYDLAPTPQSLKFLNRIYKNTTR